jgi:hypothetical protein
VIAQDLAHCGEGVVVDGWAAYNRRNEFRDRLIVG